MGIIIFEPTRSDHDDDTAGHVSDDSDSEEAGVVGEAPAVPETGVACHFVGENRGYGIIDDNIFNKCPLLFVIRHARKTLILQMFEHILLAQECVKASSQCLQTQATCHGGLT